MVEGKEGTVTRMNSVSGVKFNFILGVVKVEVGAALEPKGGLKFICDDAKYVLLTFECTIRVEFGSTSFMIWSDNKANLITKRVESKKQIEHLSVCKLDPSSLMFLFRWRTTLNCQ